MNKVNTKGQWPRADTARPTPSLTLANERAQHMEAYNVSIIIINTQCITVVNGQNISY